jgi:hypothetical protein
MWHCDGYDKLKPFGICIHAAIDGWSRKIVWLRVGRTNNDPNVVCNYYTAAIRKMGFVPLILRVDAGTENCLMVDVHSILREDHDDEFAENCVFIGSSPHNQRIERWWRYLKDTYINSCLSLFKDMRDSGVLDLSDAIHIECLRFCFIPVIQTDLDMVRDAWNNHRIRKQNTLCPSDRPLILYNYPELFGCCDMKMEVDMDVLDMCEDIQAVENDFEMGSSDEFSEIALEAMLHLGLSLPHTLHGAVELFGNIITFLNN